MHTTLFYATLDAGVPLALAALASQGGPTAWQIEQARTLADDLGARGDQLLFGGPEAAPLMGRLIKALAVLACCPGGVMIGGCHWERRTK